MKDKLYYYKATVARVVDGDTLVFDRIDCGFTISIVNQRIRLLGVNTPEIHGATAAEGNLAKSFVKNVVEGKEVLVRTYKDDSFGRWLAEVYYQVGDDWVCLNDELLAKGFAVPFK